MKFMLFLAINFSAQQHQQPSKLRNMIKPSIVLGGGSSFRSGRLSAAKLLYLTMPSIRSVTIRLDGTNQVATVEQQQPSLDAKESANHTAHGSQADCQLKYRARLEHLDLWHSIETIKRLGHRLARLDPLGMTAPESLENLTWSHRLLGPLRCDRKMVPTVGFLATKQPLMAVNELLNTVLAIYTAKDCGLEFSHLSNEHEVEWLASQWEKLNEISHLDHLNQRNLAKLLIRCETFDHFMAAKYPTTKRYGCEGAESMLVVFDEILRLCHLGESEHDETTQAIGQIDDVIIGMPHRGRLNLLSCLLGFDASAIFSKVCGELEFEPREAWMAKGDVLSHLSTNVRFVYGLDRQSIGLSRDSPEPINVSLIPNPSHLEVSAPVVMGSARGRAHNLIHNYVSSPKFPLDSKSERNQTDDYTKYFTNILPVQVHGDAAVAGQGIAQETLQMSGLPMFTVGGSLHLVVNNQIGYTTEPYEGRSTRYCTDVFKFIEAPIIHINGGNIESVIRATRLALAYRQKFAKDVVIDLICYRKHGHNEMDEPSFTQPLMYGKIGARKSIPQQYCDEIGLEPERRQRIISETKAKLQEAHKRVDSFKPDNDNYRNFSLPNEYYRNHVCSWQTGCDLELLISVALATVSLPADFQVHPNLQRVLIQERIKKFSSANAETLVDWATAEMIAFGSLLKQNHSVRLTGQDVARGTFSTRHAVLIDQKTGKPIIPLNEMVRDNKVKLEVANTILSEEAALAYEFGYSIETCELTIWEAQFGDFFNTAQSIIDTLVSSSESKWLKQSALTLLLPHGLEGDGPEHSSARLERFLQMSSSSLDQVDTEARVNWSVCFPTLPAQYFHLLRRQVLRPFRKPLVVMAPKTIFRHSQCVSPMSDLSPDAIFKPVLDDPQVREPKAITKIVLCSGKVYFMLREEKTKLNLDHVAIIRLEELCPFPIVSLLDICNQYPNVAKNNFIWFQEEYKNQGAYSFVRDRLKVLAGIELDYIGRSESELPGVCGREHKRELEQVKKELMGQLLN